MDRGEWEAIALAREIDARLLLIDDRAGVVAARGQGFTVTVTLGVLVEAAAATCSESRKPPKNWPRRSFAELPICLRRL
jgi:predicted nucleic acid-binding protein